MSVWVEIERGHDTFIYCESRSTWACELKYGTCEDYITLLSVTLHVSVWVEISTSYFVSPAYMSRSTWACELKSLIVGRALLFYCHAPRERVSWNACDYSFNEVACVTLHMSVWVEIAKIFMCIFLCHAPRERVSWNLLWLQVRLFVTCHAPRERVSQFSFQRRT